MCCATPSVLVLGGMGLTRGALGNTLGVEIARFAGSLSVASVKSVVKRKRR